MLPWCWRIGCSAILDRRVVQVLVFYVCECFLFCIVRYAERAHRPINTNFLTAGQRRRRRRSCVVENLLLHSMLRFFSLSLSLLFSTDAFFFFLFWSIGLCLWEDLVLPSCDERVARVGGAVRLPLVAAGLPILQLIWIATSTKERKSTMRPTREWESQRIDAWKSVATRLDRLPLVVFD